MGFFEVNKIPLKVIKSDGFDIDGGTDLSRTKLLYSTNTGNTPSFFFNKGYTGTSFGINIIVREDYYYQGKHISEYLNRWDKESTVVSVVTDAMDIPNGKYILNIRKKKQTNEYRSVWQIDFYEYYNDAMSFENLYQVKTSSLSATDQLLLKYTSIDASSPKEVILALQNKLMEKGAFDRITKTEGKDGIWSIKVDKEGEAIIRNPTGKWDWQMTNDILVFQSTYNVGNHQGKCDRETIKALVGDYDNRDAWGIQSDAEWRG